MRSAEYMVNLIEADAATIAQLKSDPLPVLKQTAEKAVKAVPKYTRDLWIYRFAVVVLGSVVLIALGGAIGLALSSIAIPEVLVALGAAAVGGLTGLFVPSPLQGN